MLAELERPKPNGNGEGIGDDELALEIYTRLENLYQREENHARFLADTRLQIRRLESRLMLMGTQAPAPTWKPKKD